MHRRPDGSRNRRCDGADFYVDLLLFHVTQLRYVVVEFKIGKFKPDYTGQLGFYVALVDDECVIGSATPPPSGFCCAPAATNAWCATH